MLMWLTNGMLTRRLLPVEGWLKRGLNVCK